MQHALKLQAKSVFHAFLCKTVFVMFLIIPQIASGQMNDPVVYHTGGVPTQVVVLPTANGKPSLVVNDSSGNTISVLKNNGDGTFQNPVQYPVVASPIAMAVGDFNGDGIPDLAVLSSNQTSDPGTQRLTIFYQNADGTFQSGTSLFGFTNEVIDLVTGDFNHEGIMDVAVLLHGDLCNPHTLPPNPGIVVFLGSPSGLQPAQSSVAAIFGSGPSLPKFITTSEFNKDGALGLVYGGQYCPTNPDASMGPVVSGIGTLLGKGDGSFNYGPFINTASPALVTVGDFNNDGDSDLLFTLRTGTYLALGNGDGTFQTATLINATSYSLTAIADINLDGNLDIVLANQPTGTITTGAIQIMLGNGDGTFQNPVPYNVGTGNGFATYVAIADLNGDGFPDIITANQQASSVSVFLNSGNWPTLTAPVVGLSAQQLVFPASTVGIVTTPQTVMLSNSGNTPMAISSMVKTGDFTMGTTCGTSLPIHASCSINVSFTPTQVGVRTGQLTLTDNAIGSPHAITLHGTGADLSITVTRPTRQHFDPSVTAFVASGSTPAVIGLNVSSSQTTDQSLTITCGNLPHGLECTAPAQVLLTGGSSDFQVKVGLSPQASRSKRLDTIHTAPGQYSVRIGIGLGAVIKSIDVPFVVE